MRAYIRVMDKVNRILKFIVVLFIGIAFISLCLQVFSRFVLQLPMTWSEELSRYLLIWSTFLSASIAVRYQQLIRIEVVNTIFPRKIKIAVGFIAFVITSVFCGVVIYYGMGLLNIVHAQTSPALRIPMSIPYSAIPVGCLFIILNYVAAFYDITQEGEFNK